MEATFLDIPNELQILILDHLNIDDISKIYLSSPMIKDNLDYLISKKNYDFIGRYKLLLDDIIFQPFHDAFMLIIEKRDLFRGFIDKIYQNKILAIKIWEEYCIKYNFILSYMARILEFVLEKNQVNYNNGKFNSSDKEVALHSSLFMNKLVIYLNN